MSVQVGVEIPTSSQLSNPVFDYLLNFFMTTRLYVEAHGKVPVTVPIADVYSNAMDVFKNLVDNVNIIFSREQGQLKFLLKNN